MRYFLAVDGGGTRCRALLADGGGAVLGAGTAGPANIGADRAGALSSIAAAASKAAQAAGLDEDALRHETRAVLGLAGANALADRESLARQLPFAQSLIVSDAVTALQGALGDDGDGAIVILGTGSAFVKRTNGQMEITGGRGFMLSDHAGGARLGRELLEEALLATDGMAEPTGLTQAVLARFDHDARTVTAFSRHATAADYATFAPLVFEYAAKGDPLGLAIARRACAHIGKGLQRMGVERLGRFSMTGGLAASYAALPFLPHAALYVPARGDALQGALALALPLAAIVSHLLKHSLKEVMDLDYVVLARVKGFSETQVILREALKNAALPTLTLVGVQFTFLIGGTVIVERLFSYEGLGNMAIDAVINRDLPLIQGIVLVFALLFVLINLAVDMTYALLNPRLRHG